MPCNCFKRFAVRRSFSFHRRNRYRDFRRDKRLISVHIYRQNSRGIDCFGRDGHNISAYLHIFAVRRRPNGSCFIFFARFKLAVGIKRLVFILIAQHSDNRTASLLISNFFSRLHKRNIINQKFRIAARVHRSVRSERYACKRSVIPGNNRIIFGNHSSVKKAVKRLLVKLQNKFKLHPCIFRRRCVLRNSRKIKGFKRRRVHASRINPACGKVNAKFHSVRCIIRELQHHQPCRTVFLFNAQPEICSSAVKRFLKRFRCRNIH